MHCKAFLLKMCALSLLQQMFTSFTNPKWHASLTKDMLSTYYDKGWDILQEPSCLKGYYDSAPFPLFGQLQLFSRVRPVLCKKLFSTVTPRVCNSALVCNTMQIVRTAVQMVCYAVQIVCNLVQIVCNMEQIVCIDAVQVVWYVVQKVCCYAVQIVWYVVLLCSALIRMICSRFGGWARGLSSPLGHFSNLASPV